ncbi:MAG TPA: putative DNA binding domain-containing protein [Candidatus Goldiibacteriota bacterium]|nr:putative DNA binding domain-containing protein [Candidatus Goldiibacteriota bacterium]HRQ44556.1 putative DNA binding domain-containing protein [Candidatus Goldiibacteriota bacterium]
MPSETEWLEFKEAKEKFDYNDLGKYFSALSNEANLQGKEQAWLIFGVEDKKHKIVGTLYKNSQKELDVLKHEISKKLTHGLTFRHIHTLETEGKRVLLFEIPSAPEGIPIAWDGHYYGRNGASLVALNISEIETIRNQASKKDWSAEIVESADINDLEPEAIKKAREKYKEKYPAKSTEVDKWDNATFLNKAKITINGKITRAALILLGRPESLAYISPYVCKITWILKNDDGTSKDYQHFEAPLLTSVDEVFTKIRNVNLRIMPGNSIFPIEIKAYEPFVIREALNNCIAHQDYTLQSSITVTEKKDELVFSNAGSFIPGTIEAVIKQNAPQRHYRNQFLADAMVNLKMIDTIGSGIIRMYTEQKKRLLPMPTYEISEKEVTVKIYGKEIDENYTRILMNKTDMDIDTVILLDYVQKKKKLQRKQFDYLKKKKLIEGRYPNPYVAASVADAIESRETYIKNRGFDDKYYKNMIIELLDTYGKADRAAIDRLLTDKLSNILDDKQKSAKIRNIIYSMSKREQRIKNIGTTRKPIWVKK